MSRRDDGGLEQASFAKRRDLENHLSRGMSQIVLDATCAGVALPEHLMGQEQVVLNLSYAFHLRVFELDLEGVRASLSFSGREELCVIPWRSVYFIRLASGEEEGSMYLESMPLSMREQLMRLAGLGFDDLDEDLSDSFDLSSSVDDEDLPPIVTPAPPRPALRRADQVSDESLDEDSAWASRLPQVESPERVALDASDPMDATEEEEDDEEGAPISFTELLNQKKAKR